MNRVYFEWDDSKDELNYEKHNVTFFEAQQAFFDPQRVIALDLEHSHSEKRYYCFGIVENRVMTVRFTYREHTIRIIGAGYWRKGRKIYDQAKNQR